MKRLLLFILFFSHIVWAETHQIGILAQRGEVYTRTHWQPWVDWLNKQFPNERAELDFLLTNPAQFFYLSRQNVRWLATLGSPFAENGEQGAIGSSIWVRTDSPYQSLPDLKGKLVFPLAPFASIKGKI